MKEKEKKKIKENANRERVRESERERRIGEQQILIYKKQWNEKFMAYQKSADSFSIENGSKAIFYCCPGKSLFCCHECERRRKSFVGRN